MNTKILASSGSVVSAIASSACCWLPLVLMGAGLSAAGVATFFERYRPVFLVAAALLLGVGFYLNYFRKERCAPGSACETPNPRLRRVNRGMLWISTLLVVAFALFPSYIGTLIGVQKTSAETAAVAATDTWTIQIDGMTCAGCEAAVQKSLLELPGVTSADVSSDAANATLTVDAAYPPTRMALATAVAKAGYTLVATNETRTATAPALEGHWVAEISDQDGTVEVIMDLGVVNSRWVGQFDLAKYKVMNYPVEVRSAGETIELFLTAIGMTFEGTLGEDGTLTGVGYSQGEKESITFARTGPAEFSQGFLDLEAAADDPTRVEILSGDGTELRTRFNEDSAKTRLVMLLSPT